VYAHTYIYICMCVCIYTHALILYMHPLRSAAHQPPRHTHPTTTSDTQQTVWVEGGDLNASFVFHFAAGWEEEEEGGRRTLKLYAMKYDHFELDFEGTFFNASDPGLRFTRGDLDARWVLVDFGRWLVKGKGLGRESGCVVVVVVVLVWVGV
jgi:hypothetical protein